MNLYYHESVPPNVGDALNAVLWPRVVPGFREVDLADWLVGAGTIIDQRLVRLRGDKIVVGSGVRCDSHVRRFGADVRFAGVRGLLSARWLGLPDVAAVGDPGFLVALWNEYHTEAADRDIVGLVPHVYTLAWSGIAERAVDVGLEIVNPTLPVETFLRTLARCSRVFCESLHGAILAEALRIPWTRVRLCAHHYEGAGVAEFKWLDAFSVLGVDVTPVNSVALAPVKRSWPATQRMVRPLQQMLQWRLLGLLGRLRDEPEVFHLAPEYRLRSRVEALLECAARLQPGPAAGVFQ